MWQSLQPRLLTPEGKSRSIRDTEGEIRFLRQELESENSLSSVFNILSHSKSKASGLTAQLSTERRVEHNEADIRKLKEELNGAKAYPLERRVEHTEADIRKLKEELDGAKAAASALHVVLERKLHDSENQNRQLKLELSNNTGTDEAGVTTKEMAELVKKNVAIMQENSKMKQELEASQEALQAALGGNEQLQLERTKSELETAAAAEAATEQLRKEQQEELEVLRKENRMLVLLALPAEEIAQKLIAMSPQEALEGITKSPLEGVPPMRTKQKNESLNALGVLDSKHREEVLELMTPKEREAMKRPKDFAKELAKMNASDCAAALTVMAPATRATAMAALRNLPAGQKKCEFALAAMPEEDRAKAEADEAGLADNQSEKIKNQELTISALKAKIDKNAADHAHEQQQTQEEMAQLIASIRDQFLPDD